MMSTSGLRRSRSSRSSVPLVVRAAQRPSSPCEMRNTSCPSSQPPIAKASAMNQSSAPFIRRSSFHVPLRMFRSLALYHLAAPKEMNVTPPGPDQAPLFVVTGAGKGVGHETALALARDHRAQVIAVSRDVSAWSTVRESAITPVSADVATDDGRSAVVRAVGGRPLAGLVNNAGTLLTRAFGEWTAADLQRLYAVNAAAPDMRALITMMEAAPLLLVQALLPDLRASASAHVVNIGSMGGFQGSAKFPGLVGYSASKAALACISECLAEELKDTSVRCNCLCLGAVDTAMLREAFPGYDAPVTAGSMGGFIAEFSLKGHKFLNGKVLPVALSTP